MTRTRYTDEFKVQAVELAGLEKPVSEVAADLNISADLIYRWRREMKDGFLLSPRKTGQDNVVSPEVELRAILKENKRLKLENDILKKAAVILGTTPLSKNVQ